MKYVEEYLREVIKVEPLGELTTKEETIGDLSGEIIYIDGKCTDIFVSHADYINWLEKQKYEPNWCHHKVNLSNCSEEYRKAYYDGWNNCNIQHSQCKSESNDVVKCLINGMKFYYEDNEDAMWGTEKFSMKVKDILFWLEKQDNEKKDFHEKYKEVAKSDWFKKSYEGKSCGMIIDENGCKPKFKVGDIVKQAELDVVVKSADMCFNALDGN